jgi:hypothetical protein
MLKKSTALSKITSALVAIGIVATFATTTTAFAAETDAIPESNANIAYMNLASAPIGLEASILEARNAIIYSTPWTVNGQCYRIHADGSTESLPEFYDIFPNDWDVPNSVDSADIGNLPSTRAYMFNNNVNITAPPSDTPSTPFYTFTAGSYNVEAYAATLPGASVNIGYTNLTTGNSVGYLPYLAVNERIGLIPISGNSYGVRASTYSTTGIANMRVVNPF